MKTSIEKYILDIQKELNIQIKINIGYTNDKNLYGSVIVGRFGFVLCDTWQPQSDTRFQFKIESKTENIYSYETKFINHKPVNEIIKYGHYKAVFNKEIINALKACIDWSPSNKDADRYKNALKRFISLANETA